MTEPTAVPIPPDAKERQRATETVLLEPADIFGMNMVRQRDIPEADLTAPGSPIVELPFALVQGLLEARARVSAAESRILTWMRTSDIRADLVVEFTRGYEGRRGDPA